MKITKQQIKKRLEYLRGELKAERISYGELLELQSLAEHIDPSDVELLEAAGVPEHLCTRRMSASMGFSAWNFANNGQGHCRGEKGVATMNFRQIFAQVSKDNGWTQTTEVEVLSDVLDVLIREGKVTTDELEDALKQYDATDEEKR